MRRSWKELLKKIVPSQGQQANFEAIFQRRNQDASMKDYPNTYKPAEKNARPASRPEVFEPALKQFPNAFRLGNPLIEESELALEWTDTRLRVIDHLLAIIGGSRWNEYLVLRGSLLLKAWLGEAAREPGDIDWVFRPKNLDINSREATELFTDVSRLVAQRPDVGDAVIQVSEISVDDIWTYERAPGRRIVFPWQSAGLPSGEVQMDVVFSEELFTEPVLTPVSLGDGGDVLLWTANKEISLAWKLLWLETDSYPQGKDLYDAALLAEQTPLSAELLYRVLQSAEYPPKFPLASDFPMRWEIDWENFISEYPEVKGTAKDWQARLAQALAPTFTE
jgi:hypothetical protein